MAIKKEWLTEEEQRYLKLSQESDEILSNYYGLSHISIEEVRKTAKRLERLSSKYINGMRVPTHRALYLMHAQLKRSRDFHYFIEAKTGNIDLKVYCQPGSWVDNEPEGTYEISLSISNIGENSTYRDLLESVITQMEGQ